MLGDQFQALFLFYVNPRKAASAILDHGKLWFAVLAAALVTFAISIAASRLQSIEFAQLVQSPAGFPDQAALEQFQQFRQSVSNQLNARYFATGFNALFLLALVFVPFCILLLAAWDHLGASLTILFRDFMPALAGLFYAWAAAHLPFAILWWSPLAQPALAAPLQFAGLAIFLLLAAPVLATVTGATLSHSAITAALGLGAAAFASLFFAQSQGLLYMLASPWVLFYAYRMFGGDIAALGGGLADRQNFKRQLEIATLNPHDADAHYQLGLIYAQRRLPAEAEQRFRRALEIDPNEPDTLFQLGRLLRHQEGRLNEARQFLEKGAELSPKLSSHEVWRELGAVALASGQIDEALRYLAHFTKVREYDSEGLVLYGQALKAASRPAEARAAFQQAIDAAQGAPKFRRAEFARWQSLARQELRQL
jgi:tetratricopeptide (TPR) repeat protein